MCVHPKTNLKLRKRLKELTSRSWNIGYERCKEVLAQTIGRVMANATAYEPRLQQAAGQLCWENESVRLKEIYSPLL